MRYICIWMVSERSLYQSLGQVTTDGTTAVVEVSEREAALREDNC